METCFLVELNEHSILPCWHLLVKWYHISVYFETRVVEGDDLHALFQDQFFCQELMLFDLDLEGKRS